MTPKQIYFINEAAKHLSGNECYLLANDCAVAYKQVDAMQNIEVSTQLSEVEKEALRFVCREFDIDEWWKL